MANALLDVTVEAVRAISVIDERLAIPPFAIPAIPARFGGRISIVPAHGAIVAASGAVVAARQQLRTFQAGWWGQTEAQGCPGSATCSPDRA